MKTKHGTTRYKKAKSFTVQLKSVDQIGTERLERLSTTLAS